MSTWAQWRENAKTPFKDGERVRMEGGEPKKVRVRRRQILSRPPPIKREGDIEP